MTLGDMTVEVLLRIGADRVQPVLVRRWLNEAYHEVVDEEHWPFLETSQSGVAPLTINDLREISTVHNSTDSVELSHVPRKWLLEAAGQLTFIGVPKYYYTEGNSSGQTTVKTYPVKSSPPTIAVYYWKKPADLSAASPVTESPAFPSQYHNLVVLGALRRAYRQQGDHAQADAVEAERRALLDEMRHALLDQYPTHPRAQVQSNDDRSQQRD